MDGAKHTASCDLPYDIIENIFSRLPVKSLLRFKGVCKQWKAIISDPKFAETHLQRTKNSPCLYLQIQFKRSLGLFKKSQSIGLLCPEEDAFARVDLVNHEFRPHSALEYPPVRNSGSSVWCHCDGLFLIWHHKISYALWNPSCRTYKNLRYPYAVESNPLLRSGICYDPLAKDYKVVVGDAKHYAVFYCKRNCWSEMREMNNVCSVSHTEREGVEFKGCIYWIWCSRLVCFDGRDETFKDLTNINLDSRDDSHSLISTTNSLYIFPVFKYFRVREEMVIMKKDGDDEAWMEFVVKTPFSADGLPYIKPLCSTQDNKIVVDIFPGTSYLLYDDSKRSFSQTIKNFSGLICSRLFPYIENLFLH